MKERTDQLESGTFTCGNLCASLPESFECDGDLFLVATGNTVCEDMNIIPVGQEVKGGLKDADVGLRVGNEW